MCEHLGGVRHRRVDLRLRHLRQLQAEGHVVVQRHVRIERVGLEHHRDAALRRRASLTTRSADPDFAAGRFLEAGDHPQQRRFAAARRADEDDELAVDDLEVDVLEDADGAERLVRGERLTPATKAARRPRSAIGGPLPSRYSRRKPFELRLHRGDLLATGGIVDPVVHLVRIGLQIVKFPGVDVAVEADELVAIAAHAVMRRGPCGSPRIRNNDSRPNCASPGRLRPRRAASATCPGSPPGPAVRHSRAASARCRSFCTSSDL